MSERLWLGGGGPRKVGEGVIPAGGSNATERGGG